MAAATQLPPATDDALVERLRTRDETAYAVLYRFYFPVVERFVRQNNGTPDDARDVFQETLLVLLDRLPSDDFTLTSSLKTYVFAIASNLWLKRLRTGRRLVRQALLPDSMPEALALAEAPQPDRAADEEHRSWLVRVALRRVTVGCYRLLQLLFFFTPQKGERLAWQLLGYKNPHSLDNQKYKCLEQARRAGPLQT